MLTVGVRSSYLWTLCLANGNSIVLTRIPLLFIVFRRIVQTMEFILEIPIPAKYLTSFLFGKCLNIVITNRLNNYYVFCVVSPLLPVQMIYDAFSSLPIHKSWMVKLKQKPP